MAEDKKRHDSNCLVRQCQHAVQASDNSALRNKIEGILDKIQQELADKLKIHHHIPASDSDQCASSRLGLAPYFVDREPYNAKSANCLIQASLSHAMNMPKLCIDAMMQDICILY